MTSLRHKKDVEITKLDGRYKGYNRGFRYRVDFRIGPLGGGNNLFERYRMVLNLLENSYGKEITWTGEGLTHRRVYNENYRVETAKNKWYRQLYLRKEEDITILLLVTQ